MNISGRLLKIIRLTFAILTFSFLVWFLVIYPDFDKTTAYIIAGIMMAAIFMCTYRWGYRFIDD